MDDGQPIVEENGILTDEGYLQTSTINGEMKNACSSIKNNPIAVCICSITV